MEESCWRLNASIRNVCVSYDHCKIAYSTCWKCVAFVKEIYLEWKRWNWKPVYQCPCWFHHAYFPTTAPILTNLAYVVALTRYGRSSTNPSWELNGSGKLAPSDNSIANFQVAQNPLKFAMLTLFVLKMSLFFFKKAEKYGKNCTKIPPPLSVRLQTT